MTAAKVMDIISRLPGCDGQAADAVSTFTQVKMEDSPPKLLKFSKSECPDIWIRPQRHKWPKSWASMEDPVVPLERNLYGHPLAGLLWKRQFEKILLQSTVGEKVWELGMCCWSTEQKDYSLSVYVEKKNWLESNKTLIRCGKYWIKKLIWENHTSFLDHVYLGCTQRECQISKDIVDNYWSVFESRISPGAMEKYQKQKATVKPDALAKKCMERYFELAKNDKK